jgi:hypothetical protein
MNFTDTELEALAIARSCAQAGKAFVPVPDAEIFCKNLARHGWLMPSPKTTAILRMRGQLRLRLL